MSTAMWGRTGTIRAWFGAMLFALMLSPSAAAQDRIESAVSGTVRVAARAPGASGSITVSMGTGFVVAPNLIVTNAHVVAIARQGDGLISIVAPNSDGPTPARIVSFSAASDLALLEVRGSARLTPLTISLAEPRPGEPIVALGYPDVDDIQRTPDQMLRPTAPSRTTGTIASLRDTAPTGDDIPTINHEAVISSGSSGGPLLDECGHVIGVNTWHARATDTLESRSVATRAGHLIDFLTDAGVRPLTTSSRCLSLMERVESERTGTIDALEAQNRTLAAQLQSAERLMRVAIVILIGGTLALLVAVIVLGAIVFGRHHHHEAPAHPEPHGESMRRGGRGVLVVVGGATIAGVLVVAAGVAIWRMQAGETGPTAAAVFSGEQVCALDAERSTNAGDAEDARFTVTGDLCVNGRTLYAPGGDGPAYRRTIVNSGTRSLEVLTLDPVTQEFRRETYRLSDDQFSDAVQAAGSATTDQCESGRNAVAARNQALTRFAQGNPSQRLVFHCRGAGAP